MGGRKQKVRDTKSGVYIIGEGITEQHYFSHIKRIFGFYCTIKPRFFGNTSIPEMKKKIEELLRDDVFVICIFDADVSLYNEIEQKRLIKLKNKYMRQKNVLFCDSMPSIEFWFLLHYIETNCHFNNTKEVETLLRKYMQEYEKTSTFLEKDKWVIDLCADDKLELAIQRAKKSIGENGSYTNILKAFEYFFKDNRNKNLNCII